VIWVEEGCWRAFVDRGVSALDRALVGNEPTNIDKTTKVRSMR